MRLDGENFSVIALDKSVLTKKMIKQKQRSKKIIQKWCIQTPFENPTLSQCVYRRNAVFCLSSLKQVML